MILLLIITVLVIGALLTGLITGGTMIGVILLIIGFLALIIKLVSGSSKSHNTNHFPNEAFIPSQEKNESSSFQVEFSSVEAQKENDDRNRITRFEEASDRLVPEIIKVPLERAYIALTGFQFDDARVYFDRILDIDPHFAPAYIGKLLCDIQIRDEKLLSYIISDYSHDSNWNSACRFATQEKLCCYMGYLEHAKEEQERIRLAKQNADRQAAELQRRAKAKKKKRFIKTCIVVLLLLIIAATIHFILIPELYYNKGLSYASSKQWAQAIDAFKKVGDYKDALHRTEETKYLQAMEYYENKEYEKAYRMLIAMPHYNKASDFLKSDEKMISISKREQWISSKWGKGQIIELGKYEQDHNITNGSETIQWIVLQVLGNNIVIAMSKNALLTSVYNNDNTTISWKDSSLRNYLNRYFITQAFNSKERNAIVSVNLDTDGETTTDQVFLLSTEDFRNNLAYDELRYCIPTKHAESEHGRNFIEQLTDERKGEWWLRSSSFSNGQCLLSYVGINGTISTSEAKEKHYVRPVICIDLGAEVFQMNYQ